MEKIPQINRSIYHFYHKENHTFQKLSDAILYSVDSGGKRFRPILYLELLESFNCKFKQGHYDVAAALEMIHTGSLIHDDLPAMDNDDYRRGKLTNHKKFDEATAILAGDSLFLDPFRLIADASDINDHVKIKLIRALSSYSGTFGMVGGQVLDMTAEGKKVSLEELKVIHKNKTGALLTFPFDAAGITLQLPENIHQLLIELGQEIGLAFQIRDDILDVTATFNEIGKTPQKDIKAQKSTYPSLLGLKESYHILNETLNRASVISEKLKDASSFDPKAIQDMIERLRLDV
ncbi:polyprenyl synthetase family protein [Streptococcus urinalis]|uniref:Farnesyl diphosphate synthase n=1 Tax=Streptococcus urinalis 2285-97 TaxID=764291 RepID=G5KD79_9STRE|nr:farnesyl diphosphate synthase [Streptococcus urinalis]EHJ56319.1 polyprenyl synthetase [Streptococcus urinalis 2285-97]VEF31475.1 geranyltranstransferase [Streptococcus urinalis]